MGLPEEYQGTPLVSGSAWLASPPSGPNAGLPPLRPAANMSILICPVKMVSLFNKEIFTAVLKCDNMPDSSQ